VRIVIPTLLGLLVALGGASAGLQECKQAYLDAAKIEEYGGKLREALNTIGGFQPPCGLKVVPTAYPYMALKDDKSAIQTVFEGTDVAESGSWTEVGPGDFRALIYGIHELSENWFKRVSTVVDLAQEPAKWALKVHEETHAWEGAVEKVGETWDAWEQHKGSDDLKTAIASRTLAVLGLVVSENWRAIFNEANKAAHIAANVGKVEIPAGVYGNDNPIELDFSKCETPGDVTGVIKGLIKAVFGDDQLTPARVIALIDREAEHFGLGSNFVETYLEGGQYEPHPGGFTKDEMKQVIELFKQGKDVYGQPLSEDALAFAVLFSIENVWATYEEYVHQYGHFFPPAADDAKLARDKIQEAVSDLVSVLDKLNAWADVGITKVKLKSNPIECAPAVKDWAVGQLFGAVGQLQQKVSELESKVSELEKKGAGKGTGKGETGKGGKGVPVNPLVALAGLVTVLVALRRR